MKKSVKRGVITVIAIIVVLFIVIPFCCGLLLGGMMAEKETKVKENTVFVLKLSGTLSERGEDNPLGSLLGDETENLGLNDILTAIKKAKENEKIHGIYINAKTWVCDSPASAQAIREALADFKGSGKWVIAYADTYTQSSYYICSVADKVCLNPAGMIMWRGMGAQPYFVKHLLAKVGIKMQTVKVGKYKSAVEMYTEEKMSDANREQVSVYINNIWDVMLADVSESRGISVEDLDSYADGIVMTESPGSYVERGLVDTLVYRTAMNGILADLVGVEKEDDVNTLGVSEMVRVKSKDKSDGGKIAVYYAYGTIVDSPTGGLASDACIASSDVIWDLKDLAEDDDVKAVVLRVNSGGGSAYASEQIWQAMVDLKAKKPVVVSMGGYAASGGYYISCPANYIYAEPTTITGSIGIFGMFVDMSDLLTKKLEVKFDEVKTNRNSTFGDPSRPFNSEELACLEEYIERGYNLFLTRVSMGRGMSVDSVNAIAQGRVWTGGDALGINLVDELGGLDEAVAKAASLAEIADYSIDTYPAKKDFFEQLLEDMFGMSSIDVQLKEVLGEHYAPMMFIKEINNQNAIQARMTDRIIFD